MQPQTPVTPQSQSTGSKTLFVGNLPFQVERSDVYVDSLPLLNCEIFYLFILPLIYSFFREEFFKGVGEIVDIRFSTDAEGNFKGFGHVEFATEEAAQKVGSFFFLLDLVICLYLFQLLYC